MIYFIYLRRLLYLHLTIFFSSFIQRRKTDWLKVGQMIWSFVKYNRALRRRFIKKDSSDPIILVDIDESNEWLLERMEDSDHKIEFVFGDDDF